MLATRYPPPYASTTMGHRPTPSSCTLHHWPHVLCSVALVATPAESPASNKTLEFSGVTGRRLLAYPQSGCGRG